MPRLTRKKKAYGGKFSKKKALKITLPILVAELAAAYMLGRIFNPPRAVTTQSEEPFEFPEGYRYQGQQAEMVGEYERFIAERRLQDELNKNNPHYR